MCVGVRGCTWVCAGVRGCAQVCAGVPSVCGYAWVFGGCVRVCMGVRWVGAGVRDHVRVYVDLHGGRHAWVG